ncbi:MAG: hypothetical protein M3R17_17580, partial [Bacteroidota bacterium]|nr:hypothetical protein [Bacteroidota bacterium]
MLYEAYLETYMAIVEYTTEKEKAAKYKGALPEQDIAFFRLAFTEEKWQVYEIDYLSRLLFACSNMVEARKTTEYMFMVHITAASKDLRLVSFVETKLIREALEHKLKVDPYSLKDREVNVVFGRSTTTKNLKIGDSLDGLHVYFITDPFEVDLRSNPNQQIFLKHPKIDHQIFEVEYLTIHRRQEKDFFRKLYNDNKHIISASKTFFKYLAYMPVLVEAGIAGLAYEVIINEVVVPTIAKHTDERLEIPLGFLAGGLPKPKFARPSTLNIDDTISDTVIVTDRTLTREAAEGLDDIARGISGPGTTQLALEKLTPNKLAGIQESVATKVDDFAENIGVLNNPAATRLQPGQKITLIHDADQGAKIGKAVELDVQDLGKIADIRHGGEHGELWQKFLSEESALNVRGKRITNGEILKLNPEGRAEIMENLKKKHGLDDADTILADIGGKGDLIGDVGKALTGTQVGIRNKA